jgi:iron-sulfur cluster repair protein YtfE (RIC family)
MRNGSHELNNVDAVASKLPEARELLREARIDSTTRMSLRDAALAVGTNPDELLAQMEAKLHREAKLRRSARRAEELELSH